MSNNTGGSAYPSTPEQWERGMEGMTLRDWFAGQALKNNDLLDMGETVADAQKELGMKPEEQYDYKVHWPMIVAQRCYAYADAMLAERSKG
jgi:hypothetical protein